MNDDIKTKTRAMGGINALVHMLDNEVLEVRFCFNYM